MPSYDYSTLVDRSRMSSSKWNKMYRANPDTPPGIPPFSVADLDLRTAPEISEGLREFLNDAVLGYTNVPESYTRAVIGWMQQRHGWAVDPAWLVQTPGVVPAIYNAVRAFTSPGDGIIVQTPAYYPFYAAIERNGRRVVRNPLILERGRFQLDFDALEALAADPRNRLLLFCSPHNPTGRVWKRDELRRVAEIALAHDLVVVSDEIHFDLTLPGHAHTVLATVDARLAERCVVCTAPSKTFNLAGMHTSNIVIPGEALRARFTEELQATGFSALTPLGYRACELAYTQGGAWLDGLLELVANNAALLRDFMQRRLPKVTVFDLEGTYLQWMDFRGFGLDAEELRRINEREALVFFDEGPMFGEEGAGFERMNLASPTAAVQAALERLAPCYAHHS
ncbi:MAG TPA: MalY/PatB family protein [Nevskiaceae bacterium]